MKVTHDLGQLEDGESHILTLKDSRILDDEGNAYYYLPPPVSLTIRLLDDELQNVEMAEAERVKERNELKIKRRDYTGYDDEEFVEGREGMKRRILSKYDEFLEGPKETVSNVESILSCFIYFEFKGFRLGASNLSNGSSTRIEEEVAAPVNRALLSIDYTSTSLPSLHASSLTGCPENIESSDYLQKAMLVSRNRRYDIFYHRLRAPLTPHQNKKSVQYEGSPKTPTSCPLATKWK